MRSVWVSAVRHSRGCALSPPPPHATTHRLGTKELGSQRTGKSPCFLREPHTLSGLCARAGGSASCSGSVWPRHARCHRDGDSCSARSSSSPNHTQRAHILCGSWGSIQGAAGLEPIWSHNK